MKRAQKHAAAHGDKFTPVLSPDDTLLFGPNPSINVKSLHAAGFKVVPWTTNDPEKMKALIALGVDGIISDRPDLLQQVVAEERAAGHKLTGFDVEAHRGGRGLRPENTLPSFESGIDQGATTLETDTGVTTDGVSLIWHDQFLNPLSCRRQDGAPYTMENRVYIKDISMADAQKTFICDKLRFGPSQKNDPGLSPVAEAFAAKEGLPSPYVPTNAAQLFEFVRFYTAYYKTGPGKNTPGAKEHAAVGAKVRFNLETKIMPEHIPGRSQRPERPDRRAHQPHRRPRGLRQDPLRRDRQGRYGRSLRRAKLRLPHPSARPGAIPRNPHLLPDRKRKAPKHRLRPRIPPPIPRRN